MPVLALAAALGASVCWAVGSLIAHRPATRLGAFEFTRTQLISSSALLVVVVSALNGWRTVAWAYWPSFAVASLVGVIFTNLAMIACLRRGGPRRMQLLVSMSAPIAALLGFSFLGESMSLRKLFGVALAFGGLFLAILFGRRGQGRFESIQGSLAVVIALGLFAAICHAVGLVTGNHQCLSSLGRFLVRVQDVNTSPMWRINLHEQIRGTARRAKPAE